MTGHLILLSYFLASIISFATLYAGWKVRRSPGAYYLLTFLFCLGTYFALVMGESLVPDFRSKVVFAKLEYVFLDCIAPSFLLFTLDYTGRLGKHVRSALFILLIEPVITLALIWTNDQHHLLWQSFKLAAPLSVLRPVYGSWFWLHTAYAFGLTLLGMAFLIPELPKLRRSLQVALAIVLSGLFVTLWGIALYVTGNLTFNPAAMTSGLTLIVSLYALKSAGLFDVVPIARERILEHLETGTVTLNASGRIIDINPAIERLLDVPKESLLRKSADVVFGAWPEISQAIKEAAPRTLEIEIPVTQAGTIKYLEVTILPLKHSDRLIGHLVTFKDISQYRKLTLSLKETLETEKEARTYAEALRDITLILTSIPSTKGVLKELLAQAERLVSHDSANISLLRDNAMHIVEWRGYDRFGPTDFLSGFKQPLDKFVIDRRVIEEGHPQIIKDTHTYPGWVVVPETAWIRSHMIIPIKHQGRILGLLRLDSATPGQFSERDVKRLLPLAHAAGIALVNAQLYEQVQQELHQRKRAEDALHKQIAQLEALFRFTEELAPLLDIDQVCEAVTRGIHTYLGFEHVGVFLLDEERQTLVLRSFEGWDSYLPMLKVGEGLSSRAFMSGQVQYTPNVLEDPAYVKADSNIQPGSEVDIPLWVEGKPRGVIVVERSKINAFSPEDIHILVTVGNEASIALSRALTYSKLREAEAQYRKLFNSVPVGLYLTTPDGRFLRASQALADILHYPDVVTLLSTPVENLYVNPAEREQWRKIVENSTGTVVYEVMLRCYDGDTIWVRNQSRAVRDSKGRVLYYDGFLEDITVEVRAREERERHLAHIQRQAQQMAVLNQIFLEMSQEHDVETLLQSITKRAVELLEGTGGGIYLAEPEKREVVCVVSYNTPRDYTGTRLAYGEGAAGLVIATGEPKIIPDYRVWPNRAAAYEEEQPFISVISVPMSWGEKILGTIEVLHTEPNYFSSEHLSLLNLMARQAAVALRNAQLLREERKRHMELEALRRASLKVTSSLELSEVLSAILESTLSLMPADDAHIFLYDGEHISFGAAYWGGQRRDRPYAVPRPNGVTYTVARTGEALIIPNANEHPMYKNWKWGGALASLPLKTRERVIGVMNVAFFRPHAFSDDDIHLLTLFADQAAIAIEHAELFAEKEEHTRELVIMQNILQALNASPRVQETFPAISNQLQALTNADRMSLALFDEQKRVARITTLDAFPHELAQNQQVQMDTSSAIDDVLAGRIHVTPDLAKELGYPGEEALYKSGYKSRVNIPLRVGDKVLGTLNLAWKTKNGFRVRHLPILQQVADALAMSLERDNLLEFTQQQAKELSTLYETALVLGQAIELPSLLGRIQEAIRRLMEPDSVGIFSYLADEQAIEVLLAMEQGRALHELEGKRFPIDQAGLTGWIASEGRSILVQDLSRELDSLPVRPRRITELPRSFVGVPLTIADKSVGALTVQAFTPNAFTKQHLRFLESLGSQLAILLENARAYEAERRAREQTEHLLEAAQALSSTLNLQDVFARILTELEKVVPYDSASVQELRGDKLHIIGGRGFNNPEEIIGQEFDVSQDVNPNYRVVSTRQPIILNDAPKHYDGFTRKPYVLTPIRSWLGVPMLYGDQLIGIITLDKREPHFYTAEHARIAQAFAAQAAIAIQNAHLYEAVQEQARQVQRILDTIPDGIFLLDTHRRVLMTNPAGREFLGVLGLQEGDVLIELGGRPIDELLASRDGSVYKEFEITQPEYRMFETTARPLGQQDHHSGWVLLLRDVTKERYIQAQIQQRERLAAIGQLAAGIAHDFNNILQGIIGFANLLGRRQDVPEDVRRRLRLISEQGERGAALIRQILDFSRRSTPHRVPIVLEEVVQETMIWWESSLQDTVVLRFQASSGPHIINADKTQVQQVLTNLVMNAQDAMPDGGEIVIKVNSFYLAPGDLPPVAGMDAGSWVVLTVSDTGEGIPKEVLPHIFEPFFTTKDVNKGTGLGLSQVYGIVRQHEGFIEVESTVGKGTTFNIYFPRRTSLRRPSRQEHTTRIEQKEGVVLVMLSDNAEGRTITRILQSEGYRSVIATSTEEALTFVQGSQGEIVALITDWTEPTLFSQLRRSSNSSTQPRAFPLLLITQEEQQHFGQAEWDNVFLIVRGKTEDELRNNLLDAFSKCFGLQNVSLE